jgi:multidrug resistance efflux pump
MIADWVGLMCQMLPRVLRACVVQVGSMERLTSWPQDDIDVQDLYTAAELVGRRKSPVISAGLASQAGEATMMVAYPLSIPEQADAVFAVELYADQAQQSVILQLLQWGQNWLQWFDQSAQKSEHQDALAQAANIVQQLFAFNTLAETCTALASILAQRFDLDRVSVGLCKGQQVHMVATSHHADFEQRAHVFQLAEDCLAETIESYEAIEFPAADERIHHSHERFAAMESVAWVKSYPLLAGSAVLGGVFCERNSARPASRHFDAVIQSLLPMVGPLIAIRQMLERSVWQKWKDTCGVYAKRFLGERYSLGGVLVVLAVCVMLGLCLVPGEFRVTAHAELEGRIQRAVVAPEDGFVRQSNFRAGDLVQQGDVLAELDDRELILEHRRWQNQKAEYEQQYNKELMALDQIQMQVAKAQIAQADAQLEIFQRRLDRTQLVAPIAGVLIRGDLSRSLGAPVERGDVLFEIAPINEYRLVLMVKENHIRHVQPGQEGELTLTALPDLTLPFRIVKVATVFEQQEGDIVYRTEAVLDVASALLRPGMSGYGKVSIGKRRYLWIFGHEPLDWLRMKLWRLGW